MNHAHIPHKKMVNDGIHDADGYSLEEISRREGVSRKRVQQIIDAALYKIYKEFPELMATLKCDFNLQGGSTQSAKARYTRERDRILRTKRQREGKHD